MEHKKILDTIIKKFEILLGIKNVITAKDDLVPYSKDETSDQ